LARIWQRIQVCLLPGVEECLDDALTQRLKQLITSLEILRIEEHVAAPAQSARGRPLQDRQPIARAFVAKAIYNLPTTDLLIEMLHLQPNLRRLCGWERKRQIPSPATFSRAFAQFAAAGLGDAVHAALVQEHIGEQVVMHLSRDATEISAREKAAPKPKAEPPPKKKRGRPKKGEVRPPPEPTRLQRQLGQSAADAIAELPRVCDKGTKTDSKGHWHFWVGWKAHIDWADGGLPLSVVTTSASLHDSQVAIPLARKTAQRVRTSLYDLMDSAYDAKEIRQASRELGHVPLIDPNRRPASSVPLEPASAVRFRERSTAERGNGRLKDEFGCRNLRVRGHAKAHLHVMFGIVALFADQLLKPFTG
jgi:IS5 family transposase